MASVSTEAGVPLTWCQAGAEDKALFDHCAEGRDKLQASSILLQLWRTQMLSVELFADVGTMKMSLWISARPGFHAWSRAR